MKKMEPLSPDKIQQIITDSPNYHLSELLARHQITTSQYQKEIRPLIGRKPKLKKYEPLPPEKIQQILADLPNYNLSQLLNKYQITVYQYNLEIRPQINRKPTLHRILQSPELLQQIHQLHLQETPLRDIGKQFGISGERIRQILKQNNLTRPQPRQLHHRHIKRAQQLLDLLQKSQEIKQANQEGQTLYSIQRKYKIWDHAIWKVLRQILHLYPNYKGKDPKITRDQILIFRQQGLTNVQISEICDVSLPCVYKKLTLDKGKRKMTEEKKFEPPKNLEEALNIIQQQKKLQKHQNRSIRQDSLSIELYLNDQIAKHLEDNRAPIFFHEAIQKCLPGIKQKLAELGYPATIEHLHRVKKYIFKEDWKALDMPLVSHANLLLLCASQYLKEKNAQENTTHTNDPRP